MTDFSLQIRQWYRLNMRDLPWRKTKNPYFIWLSEIILQQTRVAQGLPYYQRFIESFPTINDLAKAEEGTILKTWQGLGYYSRARNLHATAKIINEKYAGKFPDNYSEILALKGIGPYTASAIASFAFDLPHAVVDGNVYRVLSRFFGIETPIDSTSGIKLFQELANELMNNFQPAEFNQAIMEFGALMCSPKPNCATCPLIESCVAYRENTISILPIKEKKTKVRKRYFHYFYVSKDNKIALKQRGEKDVWQGLYEFPLIETETPTLSNKEIEELSNETPKLIFNTKHILSHQHIYANFYKTESIKSAKETEFDWVEKIQLEKIPISRLLEKFFENELIN